MNGFEAILLGVVQGLTEFLPISSSGHLILVPWLVDIRYLELHPAFNRTFDVALHLGTLVGVVAYFRRELTQLVVAGLRVIRRRRARTQAERLAVAIVVGTIPAVIAGKVGEDFITSRLGQPWQIAILLAVFGLLLALADRRPQRAQLDSLTNRQALTIGIAQVASLAPGVSRSGVTITAARFLGLDRDAAARFSFLLLVPVTAGAVVLKGVGAAHTGLPSGQAVPVALGMIASAVSGYAAIWGLLAFVRRHSYDVFVVYRVLAAALVLALIATGVRGPNF
jgi:undecaprenyl-diphosphatase